MSGRSLEGILLLLLLTSNDVMTQECVNDTVIDGFAGNGVAAGDVDTSNLSMSECLSACGKISYPYGAVESGQWCFCYSDTNKGLLSTTTGCTLKCSLGTFCGGGSGQMNIESSNISIPISIHHPIDITLTNTAPNALILGAGKSAAWTAQAKATSSGATFLFDARNGETMLEINGTSVSNKTTFSQEVNFWAPGEYAVRISAKKSTSTSTLKGWTLNVELPLQILNHTCPESVPNEADFTCTVETNAGDGQLNYTLDNVNIRRSLKFSSVGWQTIGTAPPYGRIVSGVFSTGGAVEFVLRQTVNTRSRVHAVWWLGGDAQSCILKIVRPRCNNTVAAYCPLTGTCSSICPETSGHSLVCPGEFSSTAQTCSRSPYNAPVETTADYSTVVYSLDLAITQLQIGSIIDTSALPLVDPGSVMKVLLTIIINSFEEVKRDIAHQSNDCEMVDFIVQRFKSFVGLGGTGSVAPLDTQSHKRFGSHVSQQLVEKFNRLYDKANHSLFGGNLK